MMDAIEALRIRKLLAAEEKIKRYEEAMQQALIDLFSSDHITSIYKAEDTLKNALEKK